MRDSFNQLMILKEIHGLGSNEVFYLKTNICPELELIDPLNCIKDEADREILETHTFLDVQTPQTVPLLNYTGKSALLQSDNYVRFPVSSSWVEPR